ncbi:MAG: GAF domain-containing protein [Chloroflexi bacterium]|nr:GAF domain-containing protein [Chloroflexota bacterium]
MSTAEDLNRALVELTLLVNSTMFLDEIQEEFGRLSCSLVGADRVAIGLADPVSHSIENLLVYGAALGAYELGKHRLDYKFFETPWFFSTMPYIVDDHVRRQSSPTAASEAIAEEAGFKSTLVAPIVWRHSAIAAITFRSKSESAFDASDLKIAESIANQIAGAIANHITYSELRTELTERELLAQISRVITSSSDMKDAFGSVGELITDLIPSERLSITLISKLHEAPVSFFTLGKTLAVEDHEKLLPIGIEVVKLLEKRRVPFVVTSQDLDVVPDLSALNQFTEQLGLNSWMVAPLEWQGELIGIIHFRSIEVDAYSHLDLELAGRVANQIAGSVAGMVALEEQTTLARERELLANIGRITSSSLSIRDTFAQFAEVVGELIPADRTTAFIYSGAGGAAVPALIHGVNFKNDVDSVYPPFTGDMDEMLRKVRSPVVLDGEAEDAPRDVSMLDGIAREHGLHSWLVAPLFWRDDIVGNLHFRSKVESAYGEHEVRLAQEIADQISGSVKSFIAYEHLEAEALARNTLAEVARIVGESDVFHDVLPQVHKVMEEVFTFDGLSISAYDKTTDQITLIYQDGFVDRKTPIGNSYPSAESYFGRVVREGSKLLKVFSSAEELNDYPRTGNAFKAGARSFISVPLVAHDEIIGLVQVRSDSSDAFSNRDLTYVSRISEQLSGAFATSLSNAQIKLQTAALEAAENAIVIADEDRVIEWVNPAFSNLTGWSFEEIVGQRTSVLWTPSEERIAQDEELQSAMLEKVAWHGRQLNRKKDGTEYTESVVMTPVLDDHENVVHIIAIKQDITDQIKAEEAHEREVQIDARNRELQRLADSRSEFLSTVSHELRTPLTIVSSFADILFNVRSENLTEEQLKYIGLIRKSSGQLAVMINDLIDVSQADTGRLFMRKGRFNLAELIDEVSDSFQLILANNDQTLEVANINPDAMIDADRPRVTQILTNLLTNASRFSANGTAIELSASVELDRAMLVVKDQGHGISESEQTMIFSPFFRGSNVDPDEEVGVGLGLSLVKGLVLQHDGEITIDSEPGVGTTATVSLPGVSIDPEQTS